jgi:hypothetical protein
MPLSFRVARQREPGSMRSLSSGRASREPVGIGRNDFIMRSLSRSGTGTRQCGGEQFCMPQTNFFIMFVDRIFTTSFERLFTKVFDVTGANPAISCLYRACNAD